MASTTKVRDLLYRVSVLLNDSSPQFNRYSEREMVSALDDGQLAVFKYLPASGSRVDSIKLRPGTRQSIGMIAAADCKPGDGTVPSAPILGTQLLDVIRNMGDDGVTPGLPIRPTTREVLDVNARNWHSATGLEVRSSIYNPQVPGYFYVFPGAPADQDVWIEIAYTAQPAKIPNTGEPGAELYLWGGSSTTLISISDEMVDTLMYYVAARCTLKSGEGADPMRAAQYTQLFIADINAKVTAITGNNPNLKMLPFAPEPIGAAS